MKRMLISWLVTPKRVRSLVCCGVSLLMSYAVQRGAWDVISSFSSWVRRIADFIDKWNAIELPSGKERMIADLVADAVTDEAVSRLVDTVASLEAKKEPSL